MNSNKTSFWIQFFQNAFKKPIEISNNHFSQLVVNYGLVPVMMFIVLAIVVLFFSVRRIRKYGFYSIRHFMWTTIVPIVVLVSIVYPIIIVFPVCLIVAPFTTSFMQTILAGLIYIILFAGYMYKHPLGRPSNNRMQSSVVQRMEEQKRQYDYENTVIKTGKNAGLRIKDVIR